MSREKEKKKDIKTVKKDWRPEYTRNRRQVSRYIDKN